MKCPHCISPSLISRTLLPGPPSLAGQSCPTCHGTFIRGEHYYTWLEKGGAASPVSPPPAATSTSPSPAPTKARLCPECSRLLTRYPVGHNTQLTIDRCGNCAGVWLDPSEFDTLAASGLAGRIHFIFSAAWQAEIDRQRLALAYEQMLLDKLGESDLTRARNFKSWLDAHPHRPEILAFLSRP